MCQWWNSRPSDALINPGGSYGCIVPKNIVSAFTQNDVNLNILTQQMINIIGDFEKTQAYSVYGGVIPGISSSTGPSTGDQIVFLSDTIDSPEGKIMMDNFLTEFRKNSNVDANTVSMFKTEGIPEDLNVPDGPTYDLYMLIFSSVSSLINPTTGTVEYGDCGIVGSGGCSDIRIWTISSLSPPKFQIDCSTNSPTNSPTTEGFSSTLSPTSSPITSFPVTSSPVGQCGHGTFYSEITEKCELDPQYLMNKLIGVDIIKKEGSEIIYNKFTKYEKCSDPEISCTETNLDWNEYPNGYDCSQCREIIDPFTRRVLNNCSKCDVSNPEEGTVCNDSTNCKKCNYVDYPVDIVHITNLNCNNCKDGGECYNYTKV